MSVTADNQEHFVKTISGVVIVYLRTGVYEAYQLLSVNHS